MSVAIGARRAARSSHSSTTSVTTTDTIEGSRKAPSQGRSGGMCWPYSTRFAGLLIGSTKDAALAMKAQMNR